MELTNVFSTHSVFYYYGLEHLAINMYYYITEGIKNNELIYISMESELYAKLLNKTQFSLNAVKFKSVKDLIAIHKIAGNKGLKANLYELICEAQNKGYTGIRYINQARFAMQESSKADFLNWEKSLTGVIQEIPFSILCIYDMLDYTQQQEYIDDDLIRHSLNTHSHYLFNLNLDDLGSRFAQCS